MSFEFFNFAPQHYVRYNNKIITHKNQMQQRRVQGQRNEKKAKNNTKMTSNNISKKRIIVTQFQETMRKRVRIRNKI